MRRIIAYFLVLCTVLTLAACASEKKGGEDPKKAETKTEESVTSQAETGEKTPAKKDYETVYGELTADFKKLIGFRCSESFGENWYEKLDGIGFSAAFQGILSAVVTEDHGDPISNMIAELPNTFAQVGAEDFGTILFDINGDETPELFWVRKDHSIVAVFTAANGEAIFLDAFYPRYQGFVSEDGTLYGWGTGGDRDNRCSVYRLTEEGKFETVSGFSEGIDFFGDPTKVLYQEYTGTQSKEITRERFEELSEKYPKEYGKKWMENAILPLN